MLKYILDGIGGLILLIICGYMGVALGKLLKIFIIYLAN